MIVSKKFPILLWSLLLIEDHAPAATLLVPSQHPTIQSAVYAASDGDTIVISPGIYRENVYLDRTSLTIQSEDPDSDETVASTIIGDAIDGENGSYGLRFPTFSQSAETVISGLTFQRCGGAIGLRPDRESTVSRCRFISNSAGVGGLSGTIQNCFFMDNRSAIQASRGVFRNNIIIGKAVSTLQDSFGISSSIDSVIEGNVVAYCVNGGIYGCNGTIVNNTVFGNVFRNTSADPRWVPYGGGITYCQGTIRNNIVWGNTMNGEPAQILDSSTPEYCCIEGWTDGGVGNISTDPRFVDPAAFDFRLLPNSFCIDSGGALSGSSVDPDGTPRGLSVVDDPRGDGSAFDIGAYEFVGESPPSSPPHPPIPLSPADGASGESIGPVLTASEFVDPDEGDVHSASWWQMDDDPDFESPELDSGPDIVNLTRLRAFGGALSPATEYWWRVRYMDNRHTWSEWSQPRRMTLEAFDALFVPVDFPTMQAAVDGASWGDVVVVRGGTYFENVVFRGMDLHVRSVDPEDPEVVEGTVIHGGNRNSVLTFQGPEGPAFLLAGLTVTGGYASNGGGVNGNHTLATFRNNLIQNNFAFRGGGFYACLGSIVGNRFIGNRAALGGGLYYATGDKIGNLFRQNDGSSGAAAYNCPGLFRSNVVTLNVAGSGGAFAGCNATFRGNLITLNTADFGGSFHNCHGWIVNNTLYENEGKYTGSFDTCQNARIRNNIILDWDGFTNSSNPDYCLMYQPWSVGGVGNFYADPRFVDLANHDFRLRGDSPAIDAGGASSTDPGSDYDFDGLPRPVRGVGLKRGDGSFNDIGAHEFQIFADHRADVNLDARVDFLDLFEYSSGWSSPARVFPRDRRDIDQSKSIDPLDLFILLNDWGVSTGP